MKITKDLLDRYARGECSPQEKKRVEMWLDSPESEFSISNQLFAQDKIKNEVWESLIADHSELDPKHLNHIDRSVWPFLKYAAAVAIFLGMATFFAKRLVPGQVVHLENETLKTKTYGSLNEFEITLAPNANATVKSRWLGKPNQVDFCGDLLIKPTQNINLSFQSNCDVADFKKGDKLCFKNRTYLTMTHNYLGGGILVVDTKKIRYLPLRLEAAAYKKLKKELL